MKNHFNLIFSVFTFVLNFICFWYADVLFNTFFVLSLIPLGASVFILLISLIVSIVFVVLHYSVAKNYISLAITLLTVIVVVIFPFRTAKVNLELYLYENDRLDIIEMVKGHELVVDHLGNAELPEGYGRLSSDGKIIIYQNDTEQVVSFWVFRGMLSGSVELIYSSTDESLIYENESAHPITSVKKLKENWYLVDTDY